MKFRWLGAGAALSFVVVAGCSQSADDGASHPSEGATGTSAQAIQGGTVDTTHKFAVGLCIEGSPGNCGGYCSGALIAPNLVVTARHCISQVSEVVDCDKNESFGSFHGDVYVTTGSNMLQSGNTWHRARQANFIVPSDAHVCGHDIALLVLDELVDESEAKPIVPGVQYAMSDSRFGRTYTAIGYGLTAPEGVGGFTAGTRRIKRAIPEICVPGSKKIPCPSQVNENEFIGGDGTCQGDSGSSALEDNSFDKDISTVISLGVLSRGGESADGTTCEGALYTRLDAYRDLIVGAVEKASDNWTLYPKPVPDWTVEIPPTTTDAGVADSGAPAKNGFGDTCESADDCTSGICAADVDGQVCSQECSADDATTCPDGYSCTDSVCLVTQAPVTTPTNATVTTTTSGCAVSPGSAGSAGRGFPADLTGLGTFAAVALLVTRRRRERKDDEARPRA